VKTYQNTNTSKQNKKNHHQLKENDNNIQEKFRKKTPKTFHHCQKILIRVTYIINAPPPVNPPPLIAPSLRQQKSQQNLEPYTVD